MKKIAYFLISVSALLSLWACMPVEEETPKAAEVTRVWPEPPAEPRIGYVREFSQAEDLGIKKSLFGFLSEFLMGESDTRIVRPTNVLAVTDKLIYVTDSGLGAVHRFDLDKERHELIRLGEESMISPVAMALGTAGEVYVSDSALADVFVIKPGAEVAQSLGMDEALTQPTGLAVDPVTGNLYVVDTGEHQVKLFSSDGRHLESFGQRGTADGELNYPTLIWRQANGDLLVTDSLNFRVQVFDSAGNYLRQFGKLGNATGDVSRPKGVATDQYGHVYLVDGLFHVFQVFDQEGRYLMNVGAQGSAPGEFWLPTGIFIGQGDLIYVADSYNKRVQVFRYLGGG